jgi:hypothetical protein
MIGADISSGGGGAFLSVGEEQALRSMIMHA